MTDQTTGFAPPILPPGGALSGNVLAIASMMVWAAGFPAAEVLLLTWDPVAVVLARFASAMAFLIPIWFMLEGGQALRGAGWGKGFAIGGIGFGAGAWLILLAQWFTDPVTVAIIAAATPLAATIVDWLYNRTSLTRSFVIGLVAAVLGGVIATGILTGTALPRQFGIGAGLAVVSGFLFSWASFMTVRAFPDLTALGRTVVSLTGGLVFLALAFALMLSMGLAVVPPPPDATSLSMLAVYGIGALAISQVLWMGSVERLGVSVASFHINAAPFYVMLILLALGGGWSWPQAIGAAVVASGVILAQR
ncbi:MAG: DMT family transporter [Rubellimicrobium sp.]|nr:DMT family transporter [Rubellimicrobium sp.]